MGKHYFEFLEEEYQRLTSEVQEALKQRATVLADSSSLTSPSATTSTTMEATTKEIDVLFSRCYAVYTQMKSEVGKAKREAPGLGREFQDRLHLYSVQITALQENHRQTTKELQQESPSEEITFDFDGH